MYNWIRYIALVLTTVFVTSFNLPKVVDEYDVKAAYIYNFTKFIEWPKNINGADFKIVTVGSTPIAGSLKSIALTKKAKNKSIKVIQSSEIDQVEPCHILFISNEIRKQDVEKFIHNSTLKNTLIITEQKGMIEIGAVINFKEVRNRICFDINLKEANYRGLKTSAQLLKVATNVYH